MIEANSPPGSAASQSSAVDVSVCMVSLNCWHVLEPCLQSLLAQQTTATIEIILVDNGSRDDTVAHVRRQFPSVRIIENHANVGFTKANNQAMAAAQGRYLWWLNTDTLLRSDSLQILVDFLESNPAAGIVGPQVLNLDGSFQGQCRRGLPTPWASLCYFAKLNRLFPGNPRFSGYLLDHLPIEQSTQADSVSGCCLLARRQVLEQLGPADEEIFGFGEELDWCYRATQSGWQVWYHPQSRIVHLKGHGGAHSYPYSKIVSMYRCMGYFYGKHLAKRHGMVVSLLVYAAISAAMGAALAKNAVTQLLQRGGKRSANTLHNWHLQAIEVLGEAWPATDHTRKSGRAA